MKTCSKCGIVKPLSEFFLERRRKSKTSSWCKSCKVAAHKNYMRSPEKKAKDAENQRLRRKNPQYQINRYFWSIKKKYGLTRDDYDYILNFQDGKCAICRTLPTKETYNKLSLDHNHKTMQHRGLLCTNCNVAVGNLQDNPALLRRAAEYIEAWTR